MAHPDIQVGEQLRPGRVQRAGLGLTFAGGTGMACTTLTPAPASREVRLSTRCPQASRSVTMVLFAPVEKRA